MAITNNLLPQVDLPVWEWMRFAPGTTSALTALTTSRDGSSKYLYYIFGTQLYRYDTRTDGWQVLSSGGSITTLLATQYVSNQGYRGNILSVPSSTTLQIPSVGTDPVGYKIKIISGTGMGQERTITAAANEVVHDSGVVTGITTSLITDNTKKWKFNQWVGYGARVFFGVGLGQSREILYNAVDALQLYDANYEGRKFMMTPFTASAPFGTLTPNAGSQNSFQIVSQVVTVDSEWTVAPDATSKFRIDSDGIWIVSSSGNAPFYNIFYYDLLSDRWIQKLGSNYFFYSAIGTDFNIAPTTNLIGNLTLSGAITTSVPTAVTSQFITDSTLSMIPGNFVGCVLKIISGVGMGQEARIISNTATTFTLSNKFETAPNTSSVYSVTGEDAIYFYGNNTTRLYKYYPEPSLWSQGNILDSGITSQFALIRANDQRQNHGITTANRTTGGVLTLNATPIAAGTGYNVGDVLSVNGGSILARVFVEAVSNVGAVLTISLLGVGSGYSPASGVATTAVTGSGTGCTIQTLTVGIVGQITTTINCDFKIGDTFTFAGAVEPAWNQVCTVLGFQNGVTTGNMPTIMDVSFASTGPTANATSLYTQNNTLLIDSSKNWIPNEHAGKLLFVQGNGIIGTGYSRKIIGNSATTISTLATGFTPTNGNTRYYIQDLEAFGDAESYLADNQVSYGLATSATISTLTDTTKNWTLGGLLSQWTGVKVLITDPSGAAMETVITSNNATTLNIGRTVAVGTGTANTFGYSDNNGVTWVGLGVGIFSTSGNAVCWSGSRFVAVGAGTNSIAWSNDGVTWVGAGITILTTAGNGVAWNGTRFVAVGLGTNCIAYSQDAITWAGIALSGSTFSIQGNAIAWNGTRFAAAGEGTNTLLYSLEGVTWYVATNTLTTRASSVCWNGTKFLAGGAGTNILSISTDGITWSSAGITAPTLFTQVNGIAWNGTRFVIVGTVSSGTNCIAYSADGLTWTIPTTAIFTLGNGVSWNGTNFVAQGTASTNTIAYSADGITWTAATTSSLFSTTGKGSASMTPLASMTPTIGFTPSVGSRYKIYDTTGMPTSGTTSTIVDNNKKWKTNQWAGSRVMITSGTGYSQDSTISSNTVNTLSFSGITTAPDNTSTYTISQKTVSGTGINIFWNFGSTVEKDKGKLLIAARGSSFSTFDIYDLRTNRWKVGQYIQGMGETFGSGTMFAYDGKDRIYYTVTTTGRVFYYDIKKNQINPYGVIPYGMSTAILSNRMEIVTTADGLQYLYIMRHSGTEMWRTLIYN